MVLIAVLRNVKRFISKYRYVGFARALHVQAVTDDPCQYVTREYPLSRSRIGAADFESLA